MVISADISHPALTGATPAGRSGIVPERGPDSKRFSTRDARSLHSLTSVATRAVERRFTDGWWVGGCALRIRRLGKTAGEDARRYRRMARWVTAHIYLHGLDDGEATLLDSDTYTEPENTTPVKVSGSIIKAWVDGTLKIDASDSTHAAGGVALVSDTAGYNNLKIGYDTERDQGGSVKADDDISRSTGRRPAGRLMNLCGLARRLDR